MFSGFLMQVIINSGRVLMDTFEYSWVFKSTESFDLEGINQGCLSSARQMIWFTDSDSIYGHMFCLLCYILGVMVHKT